MVGELNSCSESNPIPTRDAQRAQTNLVCTRTQGPQTDWDRALRPHRVPFVSHNPPAVLCERHPPHLPTAALMRFYIQLAGWGEGSFLKSWTQGFPGLASSHPVPILPTISGQPLSSACSSFLIKCISHELKPIFPQGVSMSSLSKMMYWALLRTSYILSPESEVVEEN